MATKVKETKHQKAKRLWIEGKTPTEVAAIVGVTARAVHQWKKAENWQKDDQMYRITTDRIRQQINILTNKTELTEADTRKLSMLTNSLHRLEKSEKAKKTKKIKRARAATTAVEYKGKIDLYPYQQAFIDDDSRFRIIKKSRQTGFSFTIALEALLSARRGRNQLICSASQDQSDLIIDYAVQHAGALGIELIASSKSKLICEGGGIIYALSSNFRTVQGFHGDLYLMNSPGRYIRIKYGIRLYHRSLSGITALRFVPLRMRKDLCFTGSPRMMMMRFPNFPGIP